MGRKKTKNFYFTQETEDAIILYNKTEDPTKRSKIYKEHIKYPFDKLTENMKEDIEENKEAIKDLENKVFRR